MCCVLCVVCVLCVLVVLVLVLVLALVLVLVHDALHRVPRARHSLFLYRGPLQHTLWWTKIPCMVWWLLVLLWSQQGRVALGMNCGV